MRRKRILSTFAGVGVVIWELVQNVDLIRSHLPRWATMHSDQTIIALLLAMIILLAFGDDAQIEAPPAAAQATGGDSRIGSITANPHIEVNNYPPTPTLRHPPPERPKHNVQFLGAKQIWTDIEREIFSEEGFIAIKACFLNKPVSKERVGDFDHVRARIVFRDEFEAEICTIDRPMWLNHDPKDTVHLEVNKPECILLAVYGRDNQWAAPYLKQEPRGYWEQGATLTLDGQILPIGKMTIEIVITGEENIGLEPATVRLTLGNKGSIAIEPLQ